MKKNEILDKIEDKEQRKNVAEILDFAEKSAENAKMSSEDIQKEITNKLNDYKVKAEAVEGINEFVEGKLKEVAEAVKGLQEKQTKTHATLKSALEAKKAEIDTLVKTGRGNVEFFVPKTAITSASVANNPSGILIQEIARPAYALPNMAQIMGSMPIPAGNNHSIGYWDRTTSTRNAANVAENNTTTDSAAAWTFASKPIEKIFDWIPFTLEAQYDIAWMNAEIDAFVRENLLIKEDTQLLNGTGTTPEIQGLYDIATAFDATDFAGKFKSGNLFNLLLCVASKMSNGLNSRFKANTVIVNDTDFITMLGNQNDFGSYDFPPFARLNPDGSLQVGAMNVYANSNIVADTALVCDITKQKRYTNGIEIAIGYNTNDIIYDRMTLVGRIREAVVIPTNNLLGFYKIESIAADIAEITAASGQ